MRREYRFPPVNELVVGVYFAQPLLKMRAEHVGIFWKRVQKDFPELQQQPPIKDLFISAPDEQFPMPRYWLKSSDGRFLVQIQRNAFLLNWRKPQEGDYPHFEAVKQTFDRYFREFGEFIRTDLGAGEIEIELCELTYVNIIESGVDWRGPSAISSVIPSFRSLNPTIPNSQLTDVNMSNVFDISGDLKLTITVRTAKRGKENKPILMFEQRASGRINQGTKSAADDWFARAHDVTGLCFNSLTSEKLQREVWKFKEGR